MSSGTKSKLTIFFERRNELSGVRLTRWRMSRTRCHGSSLRNLTQTSNWIAAMTSMRAKPMRSNSGAIGSMCAVVIRVAHRH